MLGREVADDVTAECRRRRMSQAGRIAFFSSVAQRSRAEDFGLGLTAS